jgi:hypothetical protein
MVDTFQETFDAKDLAKDTHTRLRMCTVFERTVLEETGLPSLGPSALRLVVAFYCVSSSTIQPPFSGEHVNVEALDVAMISNTDCSTLCVLAFEKHSISDLARPVC